MNAPMNYDDRVGKGNTDPNLLPNYWKTTFYTH